MCVFLKIIIYDTELLIIINIKRSQLVIDLLHANKENHYNKNKLLHIVVYGIWCYICWIVVLLVNIGMEIESIMFWEGVVYCIMI